MGGVLNALSSAGRAASEPLMSAFEALDRCSSALSAAGERGFAARAALWLPSMALMLVELEFLALAVPALFLCGRFSSFHFFGALRTLRGRLITYISIVAIASAVVIAFVPNPVFEGFLAQLKEKVRGTSSDLIVETQKDVPLERLAAAASGFGRGGRRPLLPDPLFAANVEAVTPRVEGYVVFSTGDPVDNLEFASVVGIDLAREYRVSRLAEYIRDAGCDPADPFTMGDSGIAAVMRREKALEALGTEAMSAMPAAELWKRMKAVADEEGRYECVPEEEIPGLVDEYAALLGPDADRASAERVVRRNVGEAVAAVRASLAARIGLSRRKEMGQEAFDRLAAAQEAGPPNLESARAEELRSKFAQRPGVIVGKSLLADNPGLMIGSEIEFITGSLDAEETGEIRSGKRIGGKNVICYITGLYDSGMYEFDSMTAFMSIDDALEFFADAGAIRGAGIKLFNPDSAQELKPLIQDAIDPDMSDGLVVSAWGEKKQVLMQAVDLQRRVLLVILSFAVFVAGFGILLSLRILVTEKVTDIGIMMGMGASPVDVVLFYVIAGLGLGVIGSAAGVAVGALLLGFADQIISFSSGVLGVTEFESYLKDVQHLSRLPVKHDAGAVFVIVFFTVLASYQFALYPALAASRLTPLDAVRRK